MSKIIGLTGGISTGKSVVSRMFIDQGIPLIDTDKITKQLLEKGTQAYKEIVNHFSEDVLMITGHINKKKLAKVIFNNETDRLVLNYILHPKIKQIVLKEIEKYKVLDNDIIVIDVPLLFESKFNEIVDYTLCVFSTREKQLERLMNRDEIDEEYAIKKIKSQMDLRKKCRLSDFVIDNSFSIIETKKQFNEILKKLR